MLGAAWMPVDEIRRRIASVRKLTDRPFGVNLIIADFEDPRASDEDRVFLREQAAAVIEERVPLIVFFWGDPTPFVDDAHRNGVRVLVQVGSVEEAEAAAAGGVDAVIA